MLGPRNDRAERYQLSILRDLARRLLEPAALLREAVNGSTDDCTEGCDSYGHREGCKTLDSAFWLISQQAEIARLRGDDWLEKAAEAVGAAATYAEDWDKDEALAILRKHRDGA